MCQMLLGADNKPISDTYYALEMAITALENELKVDNFIKTIPDINIGSNIQGIPCEFVFLALMKMLGNISGWISVTEKLPSDCDEDWVLAQIQEDNGYLWIPRVMEYRKSKDDWWGEDIGWLKNSNGAFKVIAWMPLPEPYEPQEMV